MGGVVSECRSEGVSESGGGSDGEWGIVRMLSLPNHYGYQFKKRMQL